MPRTRKGAVIFSVCITDELMELINFLVEREELTRVVFVRKAIRYFLEGDRKIDPRILETRRNSPDYIPRNTVFTSYIDPEQRAIMEEIGKSQGGNFSKAFFQAIIYYCAMLITIDDSGIEISKND